MWRKFSVGRRALALMLDWLAFMVLGMLLSGLGLPDRAILNLNGVLSFVYYTWLTSAYGATLGKRALGLRVVAVEGGNLSVPRAALRAIPSLVATVALEAGNLIYGEAPMSGGHYFEYPISATIGFVVSSAAVLDVVAFTYSRTARAYGGTWHDVLAASSVRREGEGGSPQ